MITVNCLCVAILGRLHVHWITSISSLSYDDYRFSFFIQTDGSLVEVE